jgi:hypothetical protein
MKEIKSLDELLLLIKDKKQIYHDINGKKYELNIIRLLDTTFGNLIKQINNKLLFYKIEN